MWLGLRKCIMSARPPGPSTGTEMLIGSWIGKQDRRWKKPTQADRYQGLDGAGAEYDRGRLLIFERAKMDKDKENCQKSMVCWLTTNLTFGGVLRCWPLEINVQFSGILLLLASLKASSPPLPSLSLSLRLLLSLSIALRSPLVVVIPFPVLVTVVLRAL